MTTPTTNYGWLKPTASEKANISVINTLMDDMDADIKSVSDTLQSKIYKMAQYRLKRTITLIGGGTVTYIRHTDVPYWETEWDSGGNTGGWVFGAEGDGLLKFTSPGVYRINYQFTILSYQASTSSGYCSIGLYDDATTNQVTRAKTYVRMNTCDNVNNFQRSTLQASVYIWAGSGTDQCALNTYYKFGVQQHTTAGTIQLIFDPADLDPFRSQLTIECVRKLAS